MHRIGLTRKIPLGLGLLVTPKRLRLKSVDVGGASARNCVEKHASGDYDQVMAMATFKIGKKEFVIVPRRRFEQLTRAEQDQKDAEIVRNGTEAYLSGKIKAISLEEARCGWGV